ncbi:Transmembrane emp24 domain-containing protein 10 [Thelohanellus kitauei]|uniref:Transmembrane emp24 domain-containing protein 10 n=1 Tax=Thelohanellus kitauei TaxID=669202 RepID=A0A0C2MV39_THEKT|nr:Transmembrane emp24 domain-containing protein 10 [Thelohanellus kitauei]
MLWLLLVFFKPGSTFGVELVSGYIKCLGQNVYKNDYFSCNYTLSEGFSSTEIKVIDSANQILYQKDDIKKGRFGFMNDKSERIQICFANHGQRGAQVGRVYLNASFTSYEDVSKKNTGSNRLQITVHGMEKIAKFLKTLEENSMNFKVRQEIVNAELEKQNQLMVLMNVITIIVLIGISTWQFVYLKRYFKEKKLL